MTSSSGTMKTIKNLAVLESLERFFEYEINGRKIGNLINDVRIKGLELNRADLLPDDAERARAFADSSLKVMADIKPEESLSDTTVRLLQTQAARNLRKFAVAVGKTLVEELGVDNPELKQITRDEGALKQEIDDLNRRNEHIRNKPKKDPADRELLIGNALRMGKTAGELADLEQRMLEIIDTKVKQAASSGLSSDAKDLLELYQTIGKVHQTFIDNFQPALDRWKDNYERAKAKKDQEKEQGSSPSM